MPKIAVFAGHGGSDAGAVANGVSEKDLTLQISNALTGILRDRGYEVVNNRTADVDRNINADVRLANASDVDAVIEIHLNSNAGAPGDGTETFYSVTGKGKDLAEAINRRLVALGFRDRGVKTFPNVFGYDYLGIIRYTNAPAVLTEVFFINNPNDLALYSPDRIASAIADAVEELYPTTPNSSGNPVIYEMQRWLNSEYGYSLVTDGIAGTRTYRAIISALQTELNRQFGANLSVDGILGAKTRAALPTVRRGARGNITRLIQFALFLKGYNVIPDGVYGGLTEAAVRRFQMVNALSADGIAGPRTLWALFRF